MQMDARGVIGSPTMVIMVPILTAVAPMRYRSLETRRMPIAVSFVTCCHLVVTQEEDTPYVAYAPVEIERRPTVWLLV
jgi:hypothetical protein